MKLNDSARFAHPVLTPGSDDYSQGAFDCEIEIRENTATDQIEIAGKFSITQPEINRMLEEDKARSGIYVTCLQTYYQALHPTVGNSWMVALPNGSLRGTVRLRPVIYAGEEPVILPPHAVHPEFEAHALKVGAGDLLAIAEESRFEAGLEKLVPIESVFRLMPDEDIKEPRFALVTDKQAVEIHVSPDLFKEISDLRNSASARNLLLASLYLPCIVELLSIASDEERPELRWYQAITARCKQMGLSLDRRDLADKAQALLNNPLGLMHKAVGELSK